MWQLILGHCRGGFPPQDGISRYKHLLANLHPGGSGLHVAFLRRGQLHRQNHGHADHHACGRNHLILHPIGCKAMSLKIYQNLRAYPKLATINWSIGGFCSCSTCLWSPWLCTLTWLTSASWPKMARPDLAFSDSSPNQVWAFLT